MGSRRTSTNKLWVWSGLWLASGLANNLFSSDVAIAGCCWAQIRRGLLWPPHVHADNPGDPKASTPVRVLCTHDLQTAGLHPRP